MFIPEFLSGRISNQKWLQSMGTIFKSLEIGNI